MSEAKKTSIDNPQADPNWRPYCLVCDTMLRMRKTDFGYECVACKNKINHDLTHYRGAYDRPTPPPAAEKGEGNKKPRLPRMTNLGSGPRLAQAPGQCPC